MAPGPVVAEGDRVEVVRWSTQNSSIDDNVTVPPGTKGTVQGYFPAVNQVWMSWDNGSGLALLIDADVWKRTDEPRCADCGAYGEMVGHMECPTPRDHP